MIEQLLEALWTHESTTERDRERLTQWASTNNVPLPTTTIKKAYDPVSKFGLIVKSWDSGTDVDFEGWLSTPDRDLEKDETPPETFIPVMDGYFQRRAPLSVVHEGKSLPIGHLRKAAIIRDGKVLKEGIHPTDPAEFEHLPLTGSGVWVRGVANEEPGISAIRKGNVGGMSFIANATEKEHIPGGRFRYLKFDHWIESTVAPYPINPSAVIAVAKAFGLTPPTEGNPPMPKTLEEIMNEIINKPETKPEDTPVVKAITQEQLKAVLEAQQKEHDLAVEEKIADGVKKAFETMRLEGVGRTGTVLTPEQEREADPKAYIIKKAAEDKELSVEDKDLAYALTREALLFGIVD